MTVKKSIIAVFALAAALICLSCTRAESTEDIWASAHYTESTVLGDGEKKIEIDITAGDKSITLTVMTDAETLGGALGENSLAEGKKTQFGMYVKKVNGITADYDTDGTYWALEKNGEYLMTAVDLTEISDGDKYEFKKTR